MSVFDSTAYLKFAKLQCFHWLSLPGGCGVAGGALLVEAAWCGPPSFLWVFSLLLGGLISGFCLASLRLVLCRGASPRGAVYILFWSFRIRGGVLRDRRWVIGLGSCSGRVLIYLYPFWFVSVFGSAACLRFARLQCFHWWPTFLLMNVFIAFKGSHFWFLFSEREEVTKRPTFTRSIALDSSYRIYYHVSINFEIKMFNSKNWKICFLV